MKQSNLPVLLAGEDMREPNLSVLLTIWGDHWCAANHTKRLGPIYCNGDWPVGSKAAHARLDRQMHRLQIQCGELLSLEARELDEGPAVVVRAVSHQAEATEKQFTRQVQFGLTASLGGGFAVAASTEIGAAAAATSDASPKQPTATIRREEMKALWQESFVVPLVMTGFVVMCCQKTQSLRHKKQLFPIQQVFTELLALAKSDKQLAQRLTGFAVHSTCVIYKQAGELQHVQVKSHVAVVRAPADDKSIETGEHDETTSHLGF